MRVAIPTDDKVKIATNLENCKGFMIFEAGNENVRLIEFRNNPLMDGEDLSEDKKNQVIFNLLCDNEAVICYKINKDLSDMLKSAGLKIYKTLETIALKGVINTICR
ncbi:MAG: NifB/NifX family molybdenum-iron cluster-binding protein [Chloroherpetonaceae bacterium]